MYMSILLVYILLVQVVQVKPDHTFLQFQWQKLTLVRFYQKFHHCTFQCRYIHGPHMRLLRCSEFVLQLL